MQKVHPRPQADPESLDMLHKLFAEHYDFYLLRARNLLGSLSDAQDIMQTACLKAWNQIERLRTPYACTSWFNRILLNECLYFLRQRSNQRAILKELPPPVPVQPLDVSELSMNRWLLENLLASIEERYSKPLLLAYVYGYSTGQIARILKISTRSVRHRISYGKAQLKNLYPAP